jgi:ferredoxin
VPRDQPVPPDNANYRETTPLKPDEEVEDFYEVDETLDASLFGLFKFHLFDADDHRVEATMRAVQEKLWVKTRVGGVARYENDSYHRISTDTAAVPGNPWFICTLWLADYLITRAKTPTDLKLALPIFEWTANHALESGVLAEQVDPYTNAPISVSPLTWSHATVVSTVVKYLEKLEQLQTCDTCNQSLFRLRRQGPVEVKSQATFDRLEAEFEKTSNREMCSPTGTFLKEDARAGQAGQPKRVTLSIDVRDCIGCEVCVAHCQKDVLTMVDGKALIDLTKLNRCDLDGECVEVCPTDVVSLIVTAAADRPEPAAAPAIADSAAARLVAE